MDGNPEKTAYTPADDIFAEAGRPAVLATPGKNPPPTPPTTRRLFLALAFLLAIALGPIVLGRFVYHAAYNELKAGYDVATGTLSGLKPRLNDLELASRLVAKRVEPSVVSIYPRSGDFGMEGQGSGVIVDSAGYIVTNSHVVSQASAIQVQLSDGRRTSATLVGDDALTDLALIKIDLPNLIAAEWGDSDGLEVGDLVWAIGSPFGLERSLTFGIVSAKSRRGGSRFSTGPFQEYLQTDAAVNPGNSGGPLVNIEGKVVGINAAIVGSSYQGISFAIPSSLAREKYDELKSKGRIERAWLGVIPVAVPERIRKALGLGPDQGVLISFVEPGGPADRAGFEAGDVLVKWNDYEATEPALLSRKIAATEIGSVAKAQVVRAGPGGQRQDIELEVNMELRPANKSP